MNILIEIENKYPIMYIYNHDIGTKIVKKN